MSPEPIRIEDLAEPVLSEHQQGALAFGEAVATELSRRRRALGRRGDATGLDDYGPDDFRDRLAPAGWARSTGTRTAPASDA